MDPLGPWTPATSNKLLPCHSEALWKICQILYHWVENRLWKISRKPLRGSKWRFIAAEINLISKITFDNIVLMTFRKIRLRRSTRPQVFNQWNDSKKKMCKLKRSPFVSINKDDRNKVPKIQSKPSLLQFDLRHPAVTEVNTTRAGCRVYGEIGSQGQGWIRPYKKQQEEQDKEKAEKEAGRAEGRQEEREKMLTWIQWNA